MRNMLKRGLKRPKKVIKIKEDFNYEKRMNMVPKLWFSGQSHRAIINIEKKGKTFDKQPQPVTKRGSTNIAPTIVMS